MWRSMRATSPAKARSWAAAPRSTRSRGRCWTVSGNWLATDYRPVPKLRAAGRRLHPAAEARPVNHGEKHQRRCGRYHQRRDDGRCRQAAGQWRLWRQAGRRSRTVLSSRSASCRQRRVSKANGSRPSTMRCRSSSCPSGSYDVIATVGYARRTTRAEVRSGAPTRIEVNLDAGVANIKTGSGKVIEIFERRARHQQPAQVRADVIRSDAHRRPECRQLRCGRRICRRAEGGEGILHRRRQAGGRRGFRAIAFRLKASSLSYPGFYGRVCLTNR